MSLTFVRVSSSSPTDTFSLLPLPSPPPLHTHTRAHARTSLDSWWSLVPGASGKLKVERDGKCLLPKRCGETSSPLVLGSCTSDCAEGWNLNETGQLSRPVMGNRKLQDSLSCLSRRKASERQRFSFPVFNNKGKAFLSLCYMEEALSAVSALSATASTTSRGLLSIKLIKYSALLVATEPASHTPSVN